MRTQRLPSHDLSPTRCREEPMQVSSPVCVFVPEEKSVPSGEKCSTTVRRELYTPTLVTLPPCQFLVMVLVVRRRRRNSLPVFAGEASTTRCRSAPAQTSPRRRRSLFRIVHARGAIPNEVGQTRCRATPALTSQQTIPAPRPAHDCGRVTVGKCSTASGGPRAR